MNKLKKRKVLDVQWGTPKMPDDVKKYFFSYFDTMPNDVWVEYCVGDSSEDLKEGEDTILDKWLIENTDIEDGDDILLKHWW